MARRPPRNRSRDRGFPTDDDIVGFICDSEDAVSKREIAHACSIGAYGRHALNDVLERLEEDGRISRTNDRRYRAGGKLPHVAVLEITGTDADGELLARPVRWSEDTPPPTIYVMTERHWGAQPGPGDRILARISLAEASTYNATIMRRLEAQPRHVIGRFEKSIKGGLVRPTDRRIKTEFAVADGDTAGAVNGDIVLCNVIDGRARGLPLVQVTKRLGALDAPGSATTIAIHGNQIPVGFSSAARQEATVAGPAPMDGRTDLRDLPLITIDDDDARDFDDAVWAATDDSPTNRGGWQMVVAIADVAWYVRPGGALDGCAHERGNSVYFPDQVMPMLPEALSNGLCSLNPGEDRPCLAVRIWIDGNGAIKRHEFMRAMMRSAARLTYRGVQAARDGTPLPGETIPATIDINALYGAFKALLVARHERGTIELELPERHIRIGSNGTVSGIEIRPRHDSHRLIEEFMIAANVCAANTLAATSQPAMYRVHDEPPPDRLVALREYLKTLGYRLTGGQTVRPQHFTGVLQRAAGSEHAEAINQVILRSQAKAVYSPDNAGHFGLALRRYSHFTSPIRRYADLLVHRALISALALGEGGFGKAAAADDFGELGHHLSMTERRAATAEREAADRMTASFLAERTGATFMARISGVERFGLFVALDKTGADGLLPASALGDDSFRFDRTRHLLEGRHSRETFRLGAAIEVRLEEANPITGGLVFSLPDRMPAERTARPRGGRGGRNARGRGGKRKH